jgi:hypothetical protein
MIGECPECESQIAAAKPPGYGDNEDGGGGLMPDKHTSEELLPSILYEGSKKEL